MTTILEALKKDEGFQPKVYLCPAGYWTIGYGWNLEVTDLPPRELIELVLYGITEEEAEDILMQQIAEKASKLCACWNWMKKLDTPRLEVFINMAFNMGIKGLSGFKDTLAAAAKSDYNETAKEMLNSEWARGGKTKLPGLIKRARRLAEQMRTGIRQPLS